MVAQLRTWEMEPSGPGWSIQADLGPFDSFYLGSLETFDVLLRLGSRELRWRQVAVTVTETIISCRVEGNGNG